MSAAIDTKSVLAEMREAIADIDGKVSIERVIFGPTDYAVRVMLGRKKVGPLLFPADGQTIGQCLDILLGDTPIAEVAS